MERKGDTHSGDYPMYYSGGDRAERGQGDWNSIVGNETDSNITTSHGLGKRKSNMDVLTNFCKIVAVQKRLKRDYI